jgi:hypothetical protein
MWPDFVQKDQIIFFCLPRDDDLWYVDVAVDDDVLLLVCDGSCSFPFGKSACVSVVIFFLVDFIKIVSDRFEVVVSNW